MSGLTLVHERCKREGGVATAFGHSWYIYLVRTLPPQSVLQSEAECELPAKWETHLALKASLFQQSLEPEKVK